jgi:thymidylate synthase (FAD)
MRNIHVELIITPSVDPRTLVGGLGRLTQLKKTFALADTERGERILNAITAMGHTSLLEPLQFAVVVHNASRVFLAQITRHRHCSYVSQSQQYQDQSCFPYVTIPEIEGKDELELAYHDYMNAGERLYRLLKAAGIPQDQARYVVPGAACNDLFINANAREWIEAIFPQRICRRNTLETRFIMSKILKIFMEDYDYLFKHTGPACVTCGKCDQGTMACGRPFANFEEMLEEDNI